MPVKNILILLVSLALLQSCRSSAGCEIDASLAEGDDLLLRTLSVSCARWW